ncbi:condensin complex subunit 1 [Neocloeon triangulifer]|uniref:condensin complex subunit 1 n=1 Tax=Neocloeon triangulifer TaxID=2078957 RepID=UPI00286F120F|nr:condensin complex subunit 1 [Neocloeon triangulifer]
MEEAEFTIPHSIDELLEFGENQYYVQDVLAPVEIRDQYSSLRLTLNEDLSDFIFGKFDLLYSCIKNFQELSPKVTREVWELTLKAFGLHVANLRPFLEKGNIENNIREKLLRNTKMIFYICTELMYKFEERSISEKETSSKPTKGRKKGADKNEFSWDDEKTCGINELYRLVGLPLKNLWKKANISDDFLDQVSRICLKILEDREIGFVNKKSMRDSIFQILSVLCKEYIFGLSLIPRLLQLLMLHEHLAVPLASSISNLEESGGNTGLLHSILTEVESDTNITPKAGSNFGSFVVSLSQQKPASLIQNIDLILDISENEPYSLRTGMLEATKNLLMHIYASGNLTDKQTTERDALLEILELHLLDTNAFARSKTLQAWTSLCEAEVIPAKLLLRTIEKIAQMTLDKSSYVRKDAIRFLKTCLEHNPFSGNLDRDKISKQLETAQARLQEMQATYGYVEHDLEEVWESVEKHLQVIVHEQLSKDMRKENEKKEKENGKEEKEKDESEEKMEVEENEAPEESKEEKAARLKEDIRKTGNMLLCGNMEDAVQMAFELTKKYDEKNAFGIAMDDDDDEDDPEEDEEERLQSRILRKTDYMCTLLKTALIAITPKSTEGQTSEDALKDIQKQKEIIKFLKNCLKFSEQIGIASENVMVLLAASETTDLVEAINFIASAQQFGLLSENDSILKLLEFLHSKDVKQKTAVSEACRRIYLSSIDPELNTDITHDNYMEAMKRVCCLVHNAHPNFQKSVSLLIQTWVNEGHINNECLYSLWEMVESKTKNECVPALHTLSLALINKPTLVEEQIKTLDRIGFGSRGEGCFELAKWAAAVLALASPKVTAEMLANPFRIPLKDEIFAHMTNLIIKGLFKISDTDYCGLSDYIIKAIFKTCKKPVSLIGEILKKMNEELEKYNPADHQESEMNGEVFDEVSNKPLTQLDTQNPESQRPISATSPSTSSIPHVVLLRYVHVIGKIADEMHTFVYEDIMSEIRRQKNLMELEKDRRKVRRSKANTTTSSMADEEDDGALFDVQKLMKSSSKYFLNNTEEENLDALLRICDSELLVNENTFGCLLKFVQESFSSSHCHHHGLRLTAIQAYGKYMKLSPTFCRNNLRKFVTILSKSKDIRVKIACIHTLADLMKKYPNQCEPFSPHLYECLKDEDTNVRFEALVVISKLILSDMIRVKFQITSLAQSLTDEEKRCQDVAKYFFATLATKGNILYNLVLDMISQLSAEYSESNQSQFETIMKEVLPHIDKEKQVVSLVEKLCSRFQDKVEEIECYNLALCISNLPITSKSVKAIKDATHMYADKLKYPKVKAKFDELVQAARKQLRTEGKEEFERWQELLDACVKDKDAAKQAIADLAETAKAELAAQKEKRKAPGRKKAPTKKRAKGSDSEDDDFEQTPRPQRGRKKLVDSDEDESILQTAARNKRQPAKRLANRNAPIVEEEDEDEMESPVRQVRSKKTTDVYSDEDDDVLIQSARSKSKRKSADKSDKASQRSSIRI